jgi:hypothetical protein
MTVKWESHVISIDQDRRVDQRVVQGQWVKGNGQHGRLVEDYIVYFML